jgi:hypothetical protein
MEFDTGVTGTTIYAIDLPAAGAYTLFLAVGDPSYARSNQKVELFDDTTSLGVLFTGASTGAANSFLDAAGNVWTAAAWPASNVGVTKTFSTTKLRLKLGDGANSTFLVSVFVQSSGPAPVSGTLSATDPVDTANIAGTVTTAEPFVRASQGRLAGGPKTYWEVTPTTWAGQSVFGFCPSALALPDCTTHLGLCGIGRTGTIWVNGTSVATIASFPGQGSTLGIALDPTAKLAWFRVSPSGQWNGFGTANPATGTGGLDVSSILSVDAYPLAAFDVGSEAATANFGDSAFVGAVPAGYTSFDDGGSLAATDPIDTAVISGTVAWNLSLVVTEASDGVGFSGLTAVLGPLAASEVIDTYTSGAGAVSWTTSYNLVDPIDTASIAGSVVVTTDITGPLVATDPIDTAVVNGSVTGVVGSLAATDPVDTSAVTGLVVWLGSLTATDLIDTAVVAGGPVIGATLAATDLIDTVAVGGTVVWTTTLSATGALDTASIAGLAAAFGPLAVTELIDTASLAGTVFFAVTGTLTTTDIIDTAVLSGQVISGVNANFNLIDPIDTAVLNGTVTGVAGTLAATEVIDTTITSGLVYWVLTLVATDLIDTAADGGQVYWSATITTTEAVDTASIAGAVRWLASLAATETPDGAALVGTVFSTVLGPLNVAEQTDQGRFSGSVLSGLVAVMNVTEQPDIAGLAGGVTWTAEMFVHGPTDLAYFTASIFAISDAVVLTEDFALYRCMGSDLPLSGVPDDEAVCIAGDYGIYRCLASDQAVDGEIAVSQDHAVDLVLA